MILPAGVLAINHNLTVVAAPATRSAVDAVDALRDALTAASTDAWLRAHAPRLENGFFSITTTLLRRLPVPWGTHGTRAAALAASA